MGLQPLGWLQRKGLYIKRGPVRKGLGRALGVDAGQKATYPLQHLEIIQLRRATTAQRADRKIKACRWVQGLPIQGHRCHHRHLGGHQLGGKVVLFLNLHTTPAARPVKLEHHRRRALHRLIQMGAVHAVFVRAERQQTAIGPKAQIGQSVHHPVRGEFSVRVQSVRVGHAPIVAHDRSRSPRLRAKASVAVNALSCLAAQTPGSDHFFQQGARAVFAVAELLEVDLHHGKANV